MLLIHAEKVTDALASILIEFGEDHVYPYVSSSSEIERCAYFDHGAQPSCLVGHVLARLGLEPIEFTRETNRSSLGFLVSQGVIAFDDVLEPSELPSRDWESSPTYRILKVVQERQDNAIPWGEAVRQAFELEELRAEGH